MPILQPRWHRPLRLELYIWQWYENKTPVRELYCAVFWKKLHHYHKTIH